MAKERNPDNEVDTWLRALGIELLCHWDVLLFLHRHQASLVSAEHIARFLGYPTATVVEALDHLQSLDLVIRSRVNQGVRLHHSNLSADSPRGDILGRLMTLADSRAGRLLLAKKLRPGDRPPKNNPKRSPRGEGGAAFLKAI